jgi:hypothetical protein
MNPGICSVIAVTFIIAVTFKEHVKSAGSK